MTTTRPHGPDCCEVTDPPAYLDPLHDELDRLRKQNADLTQELATVRDTLQHRSNALNATGTHNDQLRATLTKAEKWVDLLVEGIEDDCDPCEGICHGFDVVGDGTCAVVADLNQLRAILADKEPTP